LWNKKEGINGEAFNFGPDAHVNQTVAELLDEMAIYWQGGQWHVPEGFEQAGREANLLKLSCDKALFYLNWRAVLEFSDTVEFTVDWYENWHTARKDIYTYTVRQIEKYSKLAQSKGVPWIQV